VKIGLILEKLEPDRGGLEHWTWQFARSLAARGHDVHVLAFGFATNVEALGVTTHELEMPRSRTERAAAIAAAVPALGCDVTHDMGVSWAADIIHPHGGSTIALWEHNLLRIPKWRQIRFWRERRYRELAEIEARQLQSGATIVAVSHMVQRHFATYHRLPAERVRVIHNGVDVERFTPAAREQFRATTRRKLGIRDDEVLFLMLAHNLLLKNADSTLRAAAELLRDRHPVRVVVAGGKRPEPFAKLAAKLRIEQAVSFCGNVEAEQFYAAADVFLHPTWYDPCSLVTLEAAAAGLPVITTRYNGASELMQDAADGFLLDDPADVQALAARMRDLLGQERRTAMGAAGREMALRNTFERQVDEFVRLYEEVKSAAVLPRNRPIA
jgi:UDP-glucose:(heptosyl)LPS alpha-1,3-glucosyltransferase